MGMGHRLERDQSLVLGRYHLLGEIGHGGMSDIFLGCTTQPPDATRLVVIKRLRRLDAGLDTRLAFADEARIGLRLRHPNLVQTHDVGIENAQHLIVMEYLHGPTLRQLRRASAAGPGIPPAIEIAIASRVLAGLHHAHELRDEEGTPLQVVHRDLSAENVVVTQAGEVKVLDFGIAKANDSLALTGAGSCKGRLRNMPPEQLRGGNVDRRADVYAAGVLLWEGLSRRSLWGRQGDALVASRLTRGEIPQLDELAPDIPEDLRRICARALAFNPRHRYPTAADFAGALGGYLQSHRLRVTHGDLGAFVEPFCSELRARIDRLMAISARPIDARSPPSTHDAPTRVMPSPAPPMYARPRPRGIVVAVAACAIAVAALRELAPTAHAPASPALSERPASRISTGAPERILLEPLPPATRRTRTVPAPSRRLRPRPPEPPARVERRRRNSLIDVQNPYEAPPGRQRDAAGLQRRRPLHR
jgi:serine/threonine protein kinase